MGDDRNVSGDGLVFGYLGVRISGTDVWTTERGAPSRCLGPLTGARARVAEPRRSWIGTFMSSLLVGAVPHRPELLLLGTRQWRASAFRVRILVCSVWWLSRIAAD